MAIPEGTLRKPSKLTKEGLASYRKMERLLLVISPPVRFGMVEPGQGTGLGLSITYNMVTQSLNGRIWVEDNEMGGASFKVAVPIKSHKSTELHINTNEVEK